MNDRNTLPPESNETAGASSEAAGVSRRRLINAGLSAAPVLAALHSETVLAGGGGSQGVTGCVRPSTFSSLKAANWKVSRNTSIPKNLVCTPPKNWKGNVSSKFKNTLFLDKNKLVTGFTRKPAGTVTVGRDKKGYDQLTFTDVFNVADSSNDAQLARCVAAAFLSADGASFDRVWLTKDQCKQIWNGNGNWTPFGTTRWTLADTLAYFKVIFNTSSL